MRSSVVPHTIASETAQKTNWKNHFDSTVASEKPMTVKASAGSPKSCRNQPVLPHRSPVPPNASAKPTAQYASPAIEKFISTFATTVPAFLPREKPISRNANPACMNITSTPATITHIELIPTESGSLPAPAASNVSADATVGSSMMATSAITLAQMIVVRFIFPPGLTDCGQSVPADARNLWPDGERSRVCFRHGPSRVRAGAVPPHPG